MRIQSAGKDLPYLNYRGPDNQSKGQVSGDPTSDKVTEGALKKEAGENPEEQIQIRQLVNAEKKVIAHEQAHMSVGGQYARSASYGYTQGPDGKRYVTSGEVPISIPSSDKPEQLVSALKQVMKAALAPSDPSPQDIKVAQSANSKLLSVNAQISAKRASEAYGNKTGDRSKSGAENGFEKQG